MSVVFEPWVVSASMVAFAALLGAGCKGDVPNIEIDAGAAAEEGRYEADINGCSRDAAEERLAAPQLTIDFGGELGNAYEPRCVALGDDTEVLFRGSFGSHPLAAGAVDRGEITPDDESPITDTETGDEASFSFPNAGVFPFYCKDDFDRGMSGVIYVEMWP